MQNEEDLSVQVFNDSKKKLLVLKLLGNFFNHPDLISVFIRTNIIHNIFENNKTLDANKLELFHIQYTNSLIDLFQKVKKSKEQQYMLISAEIDLNNDFIEKLETEVEVANFSQQIKFHSQYMSKKIEQLYSMFVHDQIEVFDWDDVTQFSSIFKAEYYREISKNQYESLVFEDQGVYKNKYAKFEKKLLGRLNILKFKVKFFCGLVHQNQVVEVFEFRDSNDLFIFNQNDKSFSFFYRMKEAEIDISKNSSNKNRIVADLKSKNLILNEKLKTTKTDLSQDVLNVLRDYNTKISTLEFLDELQNVDEQTNILKAMLNININSK